MIRKTYGVKGALLALTLLVPSAASSAAFAADEINYSRGIGHNTAGVGYHSYDLVTALAGKPVLGADEHAVVVDNVTYRFVSAANADAFKANPAKYLPEFGGFCAFAAALGKKYDGDPRYFEVVGGKLYVIYNATFLGEWKKDIAGNIAKASANWTKVGSVAADKL